MLNSLITNKLHVSERRAIVSDIHSRHAHGATSRERFCNDRGSYLALKNRPRLRPANFSWAHADDFNRLVRTDASNSGPRLRMRIEYVRDTLLGE